MKIAKLWTHQKTFSDYDLVLNPKDFPNIQVGDVVEIYHQKDEGSRLLLHVEILNDEFQKGKELQKDTVSIAQSIANNPHFNLRMYQDVVVNVVPSKDVALDYVELIYKEQYFTRSDMWRMKKHLTNSVMHLQKKPSFAEMRVEVEELWSKGEQVTCGYVTDDTRIAFRSSTAQVNIFIQMSSEMWEFDNYGDLYFEKAVDGYLVDLFSHWKEYSCNHDVTVTMFSRIYYDAKCLEDFPMGKRECVQQDFLGRFYEDFYRVVVQNERYDEWSKTIQSLKKYFTEYPRSVLGYHDQPGMPAAWNSKASSGNVLEVLNMALNTYEKYYLDRNFERTGKLSIVITPGPGVFEVDRSLTHITKQRTIDVGNSSDLVCMGEQPLHAVPLFKFYSKTPIHTIDVGDDYNIPHWLNHSFYTSKAQAEKMNQGKFIPRIRMPSTTPNPTTLKEPVSHWSCPLSHASKSSDFPSNDVPFVDYEAYDAQIFKLPSSKSNVMSTTNSVGCMKSFQDREQGLKKRVHYTASLTTMLEPNENGSINSSSVAMAVPKLRSSNDYLPNSYGGTERIDHDYAHKKVGSVGSPVGHESQQSQRTHRPHQALINPFAPSRLHFKVTSNRRRWAHAFPLDLRGAAVQYHHKSLFDPNSASELHAEKGPSPPSKEVQHTPLVATVDIKRFRIHKVSESSDGAVDYAASNLHSRTKSVTIHSTCSTESGSVESLSKLRPNSNSGAGLHKVDSLSSIGSNNEKEVPVTFSLSSSVGRGRNMMYSRSSSVHREVADFNRNYSDLGQPEDGHCWVWGITGEQEWTPEIKTGMDWKSMTRPASLPLTTDYFPNAKKLDEDYVNSEYVLLPEDINIDSNVRPSGQPRKPLSTEQVYHEMINQRIAQGFQVVTQPVKNNSREMISSVSGSSPHATPTSTLIRRGIQQEPKVSQILSIGRIFHKVTMKGSSITVTRYWPRHPYSEKSYHYAYRFQVPDSETYDVSWTDFKNEKMEMYKWNHVDQYICTRGEDEYVLQEPLKYWRARFFLLPVNNHATQKIRDGHQRCDIYKENSIDEQEQLVEGFLRLMETLNKIRRPAVTRRPKKELHRRHSFAVSPLAGSEKMGATSGGVGMSMTEQMQKKTLKMSEVDTTAGSVMVSPQPGSAAAKVQMSESGLSPITGLNLSSLGKREDSAAAAAAAEKADEPTLCIENLSVRSSSQEIIQAMIHPIEGLGFLNRQQDSMIQRLPDKSFISAEAVTWAISNVEGVLDIRQAVALLQRLVDEQLISHGSGISSQKFVYGFYLYFITWHPNRKDFTSTLSNETFQYEWCEVACHTTPPSKSNIPTFLSQNISFPLPDAKDAAQLKPSSWDARPGQIQFTDLGLKSKRSYSLTSDLSVDLKLTPAMLMTPHSRPHYCSKCYASEEYKVVYVDIDPNQKSERSEFGIAHYHGNYNPCAAFEIEVQWLVATGCILGDLVSSWARKAGSCGFHFLPVPGDPFALPFTPSSDPLRGPIFVPLNVEVLKEPGKEMFDEFPVIEREERMQLFQDMILRRFGFIADKCLVKNPTPANYPSGNQPSYAHVSGGMFAMIPDVKTVSPRNRDGTLCPLEYSEYIVSRSRGDSQCDKNSAFYQIGFLWSWNFMLTKRWRTANTGDEHFQDKVLADFRAFCSNQENRLVDFWTQCWKEVNSDHCEPLTIISEDDGLLQRMIEQCETPQDPLLGDA